LELIVRLGQIKYQELKEIKQRVIKVIPISERKTKSYIFTTEYILKYNILPNNVQLDSQPFRKEYLYTLRVNELFGRNLPVIEKLFNHFSGKKNFITISQALVLF